MADLSTERLSYQTALIALLESLDTNSGDSSISAVRLTLVNMVKIKLDELVPEGEGVVYDLETEPNISDPYDLYINGLLDEAAKKTLLLAPLYMLFPEESDATATADAIDPTIGTIVLPDSFLRLVSLKMAEWERPATVAISIHDPMYVLQSNIYTRGGIAKPVVALKTTRIGDGTTVQAQVDNITFTGTTGGLYVNVAGLKLWIEAGASEYITAATFVTNHTDALEAAGVVVTNVAMTAVVVFTAIAPGIPFSSPTFTPSWGTIWGTIESIAVNITAYEARRVIEYYSIKTSHVIDYLYYIKELAAEDVQDNLYDTLTWITAGTIQQLIEKPELAELAFKRAGESLPQI